MRLRKIEQGGEGRKGAEPDCVRHGRTSRRENFVIAVGVFFKSVKLTIPHAISDNLRRRLDTHEQKLKFRIDFAKEEPAQFEGSVRVP